MKRMHPSAAKAILAMLLAAGFHAQAIADDVTDAVNEGLKQYKKGEYAEAMGSLDYASQLIRQKRGEGLQAFLPAPLKGWTAGDATSQAVGAAMLGGVVTAERQYRKGFSTATVTIVTDSPMLQSIMMMFTNPMLITASGARLDRISGQKAIVKYDAAQRSGEISIVVANRFFITVRGDGVARQDLLDYAGAIDYGKMASLP